MVEAMAVVMVEAARAEAATAAEATAVAATAEAAREEERAGAKVEEGAGGGSVVTRVCRSEPPVAGLVPATTAEATAAATAVATVVATVVGALVEARVVETETAGFSARERARSQSRVGGR